MNKLFALVLLVPAVALAGGNSNNSPELEQQQDQRQQQDQLQDQSQSQDTNVDVDTSIGDVSNQQNITFQDENDVTIRNTASAVPPSISSSHACALGKSGGIGIPAANISGGKQKVDPECVRREEARLLKALGERELGVMHLCGSPSLQESLGDACGPSVTQEELRRRIDFILEERKHDKLRCDNEKDAILKGCYK